MPRFQSPTVAISASSHSIFLLWAACIFAAALPVTAQSHTAHKAAVTSKAATIPALFLSDIHFDPLRDPAKAVRLDGAPVSQWGAILASPATSTADADYAVINQSCPIKPLVDPSDQLWQSALTAIHEQAFAPGSKIRFAVLSGDVITHQYDCRYKLLFPSSTHAQFLAFVEKTEEYVLSSLSAALPGIPLYITMGNDDTGCHDNSLDPHDDDFLAIASRMVARNLPPSARAAAARDFRHGYYSAPLPMARTQILVLDDVFEMANYHTCAAQSDPAAQDAQLAWLSAQLKLIRRRHQQAWVMGHVPPGINPYSTYNARANICAGAPPVSFLSSERLAQILIANADVVRLAIFGHAHTDELRLLDPAQGLQPSEPAGGHVGAVPVKFVPSISPVFAELPSFMLASVSAAKATLVDYSVVVASNSTGIDTTWSKSYSFSSSFNLPAFDAASLTQLIANFRADPTAERPDSKAYLSQYRHYFFQDGSVPLTTLWPKYTCTLDHITAESFVGCVCPAAK